MVKKVLSLGVLVLLTVSLVACGSKSTGGENQPGTNAGQTNQTSSQTQPETKKPEQTTELEIPLIAPFSGSVAFYGDGYQKGLNLALGEVGHVVNGVKVSIKPYDDKCTPDEAVNQVLKVVNSAKLVIGPACTANTLAVQGKLAEAGIPHLALNYGSVAYEKNDNLIFAATISDWHMSSAIVKFAKEQGIQKWALINATDAYSSSGAEMFKKAAAENGVEIVEHATFQGGNREFKGILLNVQKKNPQALYVVAYEVDAGILVKQARQVGINTPLYGNTVFANKEFIEASGEASEGAYFVAVIIPDDPYQPVQEFVKKFRSAYNADPNDVATAGYTAGKIIISVLNKIGPDVTKEKLAEALRSLQVSGTPFGEFSYNPNGTMKGEKLVTIGQIKNGKPTVVKRE